MDDLVLRSSLTEEEIEENFKDMDFFAAMMASLSEAVSYENGKPTPDTVVHYRALPDTEAS